MSEIFDRPNKPGIWQREDNMRFFVGREVDRALINLVLDGNPYTRYSWMATAVLAVGRYRKIADEFGNPLCDPDKPWPPKVRIEKRWYNIYPAGLYESKQQADSVAAFGRSACIPLEVTCGEHGNVLRVIPVKEGE